MAFAELLNKYRLSTELFDVTAPPPVKEPQKYVMPWETGIPPVRKAETADEHLSEFPSDLEDLESPF